MLRTTSSATNVKSSGCRASCAPQERDSPLRMQRKGSTWSTNVHMVEKTAGSLISGKRRHGDELLGTVVEISGVVNILATAAVVYGIFPKACKRYAWFHD